MYDVFVYLPNTYAHGLLLIIGLAHIPDCIILLHERDGVSCRSTDWLASNGLPRVESLTQRIRVLRTLVELETSGGTQQY